MYILMSVRKFTINQVCQKISNQPSTHVCQESHIQTCTQLFGESISTMHNYFYTESYLNHALIGPEVAYLFGTSGALALAH